MKRVAFYGASDDLLIVEVDGKPAEEFCAEDIACFVQSAGDETGLIVHASYSPAPLANGCWVIGVTVREEDSPFPTWPIRMQAIAPSQGKPYTPVLVIEAPDDVTIIEINEG